MREAERLADLFELEQDPESLYRVAAAELRRLSAAEADFHMAYRMKCDEETKRLSAEVEALRNLLLEADRLAGHDDAWTEWREKVAARPGGEG